MRLTTRELGHLASDVDDLHRDAMRSFRDDMAEVHHGETAKLLGRSRRRFMQRADAGGALLAVGSALMPVTRWIPKAGAQENDDPAIAAFAESVELAAVATYSAAAASGKLDPAVTAVGTMFAGHHQEHAGAFAGLSGGTATGQPNQALLDDFAPMVAEAEDQAALLEIAFTLEVAAAATYLFALGALQDAAAAAATATILPVESQHAVVLGQALGKDVGEYMPSFETTDEALDPTDYPLS
ncbi:hypothetical protein BH18ACT4_BH18ACT4_05350 [soil metagenome]